MLIRLTIEQVATYWPDIHRAVSLSLPPIMKGEGERMNKILESLLIENAQCWASVDRETKEMDGLVTTAVMEDTLSGAKSLMLYTIYGYRPTIARSWKEGFETLSKFAKSQGCNRIIGFSNEKALMKRAKVLGVNFDYSLGVVEV